MTETRWITAFTVQGELQAELLRGLLKAQGIPAELSQESAARIYGLGVGPMAEVEIIVPEDKLAEAQAVFDDYNAGKFAADAEAE